MLSVELYDSVKSVYQLDFIKLTSVPTVVVCPNPLIADEFGARLSQIDGVSTVTISKFISDKLSSGFDDLKVFRKSEYITHLGTVFKRSIPDGSSDCFFQAFNLFTELRSFSLDFEYISQILGEFDPAVARAVEYFWRYTDHVDLVDEHKAYSLLAEAYRQMEHEVHKQSRFINPCENIIFWGFAHLNAGQVDLVKALSIYHDVYIPFSSEVYQSAQMGDWITWLRPKAIEQKEKAARRVKSARVVHFAKKRLSETIKSFYRKLDDEGDIFLGIKGPEYFHFSEIAVSGSSFKAESDLFSDLFVQVSKSAKELVRSQSTVQDLTQAVDRELSSSIEAQEFRTLKIWGLLHKEIENWCELSDDNEEVTLFDLELFLHVVKLNLPRVSIRPLISGDACYQIRGLEGMSCFKEERSTAVCVTSDYPGIRNVSDKYSDEVMTFLATTGPIRRGEFEFQMLKEQILDTLESANTTLFIEGGLREMDLAWDEILSCVDQVEEIDLADEVKSESVDFLSTITCKNNDPKGSLSASRLQSFIDCKRKFYFDYIEKFGNDPVISENLGPRELGIIQHDIIDRYLEANRSWNTAIHGELVVQVFNDFLNDKGHKLEELKYKRYLEEILNYTTNGIVALIRLLEIHPDATFLFEHKFNDNNQARGSVDCLVKIGDEYGIIDFKRSSGGIPGQAEFMRFDKIQLWYYLNHLLIDPSKIIFMGYLNLSSTSESLLVIRDKDELEAFSEFSVMDGGRPTLLKAPLELLLGEYCQMEFDKINELMTETVFPPTPKNDSVCTFCTVKNLCPRFV